MPPPNQTPTLQDVATRAGVSTATVSRCLNFPEQVAQATRDKVQTAVQELGYSPNFGARVMAARRTNTVGAIIPTMENAIFARGLQAFQEELRDRGYTMLVASSNYSPQVEQEQIRTLVARGADALLLIGHDRDPTIYDFLAVQNIPTLVCWAHDTTQPRPSVGFDNFAAMQALTHAVLDQGHRHLGYITANTHGNDRARARLKGVHAALNARGVAGENLALLETTYGIETGAAGFAQMMQTTAPRPTAVLCANDVLAFGAMLQARRMGLSVPGDVSVTGFDDMELALLSDPPLCTVQVPHQTMGRRAAATLVSMLQGAEFTQSVELPTAPVLRASLGPVPLGTVPLG